MSSNNIGHVCMTCCGASCGIIAEVDRAAELRDEILFRQPESSYLGDCPICCLPLSSDSEKSTMLGCCSRLICDGCDFANKLREFEESLEHTCPFCRLPTPKSQAEADLNANRKRRAKANDPVALREMSKTHYHKGDYKGALEYLMKAAELGDVGSHYLISDLYREGKGVEKDEKKELYHTEEAAIGGHPEARFFLAFYEARNERFDRAVKHWIIAANLGCGDSIQQLKKGYKLGVVSKEDFAAALRAHQAAVDATKSPQREEAAKKQLKEAT